jgi:hypothetical protein
MFAIRANQPFRMLRRLQGVESKSRRSGFEPIDYRP